MRIITKMNIQQHDPLHPGVFIKQVFLEPNNVGSNELARQLHVSAGLVSRLINGKVDVSPAMALKLSKVLGISAESWLQMQDNINLYKARDKIDLADYALMEFAW